LLSSTFSHWNTNKTSLFGDHSKVGEIHKNQTFGFCVEAFRLISRNETETNNQTKTGNTSYKKA